MFSRILQLSRLKRVRVRYLNTYIFQMDKAYLRHLSDKEKFEITFLYKNQQHRIERQFNFCRLLGENVSTFLSRVEANVDKVLVKKFKKNLDEKPTIKASLCWNNSEVDTTLKCTDIFQEGNEIVLNLLDAKYQVIVNSPYVDALTLPSSILANHFIYPAKFDAIFTDINVCEFNWYKSDDKKEWTYIGSGYLFKIRNEDINSYIKLSCKPKNSKNEGPIVETISENVVGASPGFCPFENRHKFTSERTNNNEFRVVTYNLLADLYTDSEYSRTVLFPYCPEYALTIDYRKQLIIKELLGYNSDVICLQEVDRKVFKYDLDPVLSMLNYGTCFTEKGGSVAEGVACCYNKNKFKLISNNNALLSENLRENPIYKDFNESVIANEKLAERFLDKQTVVQATILECIENGNILVVGNTHLYFHPDADHIRLLQGGMCIRYLGNIYNNLCNDELYKNRKISMIFCGDFNSVPECGIYKLYTEGFVDSEFIDWSSNHEESVKDLSLSQPFKLKSACGTPTYTNFTSEFKDCLDYIYYDSKHLYVSQVVPLPSDEELQQHTALPSIVFPSDHLSLVADLKWL